MTDPIRGCTGKVAISSASLARRRARNLRRREENRVEAYHCKHCGHWHLGETDAPRRPRPQAVTE